MTTITRDEMSARFEATEAHVTRALQSEFAGTTSRLGTVEADVKTLKADVSTLKADVSTLKADVSTLKADVSTLKADVSDIKVGMATLKGDVSAVRSELSSFRVEMTHISRSESHRMRIWVLTAVVVALASLVGVLGTAVLKQTIGQLPGASPALAATSP